MDEVYRAILFISKGVFGQRRNVHPYSYVMEQLHPNLASNQYPECQKEIVSCVTENIYREATGQPLRISCTFNEKDIQSTDHSDSEVRYTILDKFLMYILTIK